MGSYKTPAEKKYTAEKRNRAKKQMKHKTVAPLQIEKTNQIDGKQKILRKPKQASTLEESLEEISHILQGNDQISAEQFKKISTI